MRDLIIEQIFKLHVIYVIMQVTQHVATYEHIF